MPVTRSLVLLTVVVCSIAVAASPAAGASAADDPRPRVHVVMPGQSIQAVIDAAADGDTVVVRPGTYTENLDITTDGLTLIGYGARLEAPATPTPAGCVPAEIPNPVGICVNGRVDPDTRQTVPVRNVTIRGLTVGRFPSTGIVVLHGQHTRIEQVDAAGGAAYGVLFLQSSDSVLLNSTLHGGQTAGLYIGEAPDARATVIGNRLFDNGFFGIFVRSASHGTIAANRTEGACIGIGFIPTEPAEDAVSDWQVTGNRITANNRRCDGGAAGPLTGIGVYLGGAKAITVRHNLIDGNTGAPDANQSWGGGIVVNDGSLFGFPHQPIDNHIDRNVLHGNFPHDITVLVPGTGNRFTGNRCETSSPPGLC